MASGGLASAPQEDARPQQQRERRGLGEGDDFADAAAVDRSNAGDVVVIEEGRAQPEVPLVAQRVLRVHDGGQSAVGRLGLVSEPEGVAQLVREDVHQVQAPVGADGPGIGVVEVDVASQAARGRDVAVGHDVVTRPAVDVMMADADHRIIARRVRRVIARGQGAGVRHFDEMQRRILPTDPAPPLRRPADRLRGCPSRRPADCCSCR